MAATDHLVAAAGIIAPHEVLGIPAHERDANRIVEAAARRLLALESAAGSETAVRRTLARLIHEAREEMLRAAAAALN